MAIARYPRRVNKRGMYARTNADLLLNDGATDNGPVWWLGVDSGGGAEPIGPNGPWTARRGPSVITRATALITGPLTTAPFQLADQSQPGRDLSEPRWLVDPMLARPDSRAGSTWPAVLRLVRSVFWTEWIRAALWFGEGQLLFSETQSGQPVAGSLRLLNPLLLDTVRDDAGALVWRIYDPDDSTAAGVTFDRDGRVTIGGMSYRLVTLRNPHSTVDENGRSLGVFALNPSVFRLGRQIQDYASGTFRSGVPAGYLKVSTPDMSQDKADKLKANWLRNHGGDRRSIAVLNATTEFVPLNLSPVDAELAQVERLNIAEVAYAFALDPNTLGVTLASAMTYTNLRDAWLNHRDFGLGPWIAAVQDTLTALVPAGQSVTVDLDGFANPTRQDRYTAYKTGIDAGIITIDEVRQWEGLPPMSEPAAPKISPQLVPFTGQDEQGPEDHQENDDQEQAS